MKKNPLIKHSFRLTYVVWIIYGVVILFAAMTLLSGTQVDYEGSGGTYFMNSIYRIYSGSGKILVLLSMIAGFIAAGDYGDREKDEFLASLPYSKGKRWLSVIVPGILMIAAGALIIAGAAIISYNIHYYEYSEGRMFSPLYVKLQMADSLVNGIMPIAKLFMTCMALYMIAAMSRLISRNALLAGVITLGIIIMPYYVMGVINNMAIRYENTVIPYYNEITHYAGVTYILTSHNTMAINICDVTVFEYNKQQLITMTAVSATAFILSCIIAVNSHRSSEGVITTKPLQYIFTVVTALYAGLLVPVIQASHRMKLSAVLLVMAAVMAATVVIITRIMGVSHRYSYLNERGAGNDRKKINDCNHWSCTGSNAYRMRQSSGGFYPFSCSKGKLYRR